MTFDVAAVGRAGDERRYDVTKEALRACAEATDDAPGGLVFAIVPVWETIAPTSRSVASDEARKRVVHYEQDMLLHRPIEAGMRLAPLFLGESVTTRVWRVDGGYGLESLNGDGKPVIKDGRAGLR